MNSLLFVSTTSLEHGALDELRLAKLSAVRDCHTVTKADMVHNDWLPEIEVDSETYEVRQMAKY